MKNITAAILAQLNGPNKRDHMKAMPAALRDSHERVLASLPETPGGICVPLLEKRDVTATGGTGLNQGGMTIGTDRTLFAALRESSATTRLGATILPGLQGNLDAPTLGSKVTAAWLAENAALTASEPTFSVASMTPRRVTAQVKVSRQLIVQSPQFEAYIQDELASALGYALDVAAIQGTGSNDDEPRGIINTPGIGAVTLGTDGAAPTYAKIVELEEKPSTAGAGELAFLASPAGRRRLRTIYENGTGSSPVWRSNFLLGHRAEVSTGVPDDLEKGEGENLTAYICGEFRRLIIGVWGDGIAIIADPYSLAGDGMVAITALLYCDVALPNPGAFAAIKDATLS